MAILQSIWLVSGGFTSPDSDHSLSMPVRAMSTALHAAGVIPDPISAENEEVVQWVAKQDWQVERSFTLDDAGGDWYLDIDYLDTVASVYVNDTLVLEGNNCFQRYPPDVSKALKAGENTVRIVLHSSIKAGAELQARQPFYIPYSTANSPIPNGNMLA